MNRRFLQMIQISKRSISQQKLEETTIVNTKQQTIIQSNTLVYRFSEYISVY